MRNTYHTTSVNVPGIRDFETPVLLADMRRTGLFNACRVG